MKIALVSPYSWTTPGGVNTHIASLAAQLRARGHEVRILAPADGPVDAGVVSLGGTFGIPFNGAVARLAFGPRVPGRVRVALRRARADVIHVHEPFTPSTALFASISARVPVVATFHASVHSRIYRVAGIPLRPLWKKFAVKIAVSQAARDTVEGVFGAGVRIIPNGVDVAHYADIGAPPATGREVLYFGRLETRKGPQVLVEALPALFKQVPDAHVVIAGDGPLREKLDDAIPESLRKNVILTGRFDESDRLALLSASTVVALPAIGGESFGITLAEAMAAGRAVVASAIPGYAAVARGGSDAQLVPPGDPEALAGALAALLRDPARAKALGAAARERARTFDWPVVAKQIEDAYHEAISARSQSGR
ncbi:MAG TPA: glycosyltransferase family 4 protein [Actinomycetota bacterium]|nr:glycosyltransferase family 4 protein [Actinomycetota bacterium]